MDYEEYSIKPKAFTRKGKELIDRHRRPEIRPLDQKLASEIELLSQQGRTEKIREIIKRNLTDGLILREAKKLYSDEFDILQSQMRAISILYLNHDLEISSKHNPLTDIIIYLGSSSRKTFEQHRPSQQRLVHLGSHSIKLTNTKEPVHAWRWLPLNMIDSDNYNFHFPLQTIPDTESKTKIRTVTGQERNPIGTFRAISILNYSAQHFPDYLFRAIIDFGNIEFQPFHDAGTGLGVGIAQILDNFDLINDPRLNPLRTFMQKNFFFIVSGEQIIKNYPYQIVKNHLDYFFPIDKYPDQFATARPPVIDGINYMSRRTEYLHTQLSKAKSPRNMVLSHYKISGSLSEKQIERDLIIQENKSKQFLKAFIHQWHRLLFDQFNKLFPHAQPSQLADHCIAEISEKLLTYFQLHPNFPTKVNNFDSLTSDGQMSHPNPNLRKIFENPNTFWISCLGNLNFVIELKKVTQQDPQSMELFLKCLTGQILHHVYHIHDQESSFILRNINQEPDLDKLLGLIDSIANQVGYYQPKYNTNSILKNLMEAKNTILPTRQQINHAITKAQEIIRTKKGGVEIFWGEKLFPDKQTIKYSLLAIGIFALFASTMIGGSKLYYEHLISNTSQPTPTSESSASKDKINEITANVQLPELSKKHPNPEAPLSIKFAKVLHYPDTFPNPIDNMRFGFVEKPPAGAVLNYATPGPDFIKVVDHLRVSKEDFSPNQLVLEVSSEKIFIPPENWKISRIITTGPKDQQIIIDHYGGYQLSQPGKRIVVVLEQSLPISISSNINLRPETYPEYSIWPKPDSIEQNSKLLSSNPQLQNMYRNFIQELNLTSDPDVQSEIIQKYLVQFGDYINNNNFYALFSPHLTNESASAFIWVSKNPNQGFACLTAAMATRDLLSSAGINNTIVEGSTLKIFNRDIFTSWGHAKNKVFLPNGRILTVDNTPPSIPGRTPQADLELLETNRLTWTSLHEDEIRDISKKLGVSLGVATVLALLSYSISKTKSETAKHLVYKDSSSEQTDKHTNEPLTEIETEIVCKISYYLVNNIGRNLPFSINEVIESLALIQSSTHVDQLTIIPELLQNEEVYPALANPNISQSFDYLAQMFGSQIIHPGLSETINQALRQRSYQFALTAESPGSLVLPNPDIPPEFTALHVLTQVILSSDEALLRERVVPQASHSRGHINYFHLSLVEKEVSQKLKDNPNNKYLLFLDKLINYLIEN